MPETVISSDWSSEPEVLGPSASLEECITAAMRVIRRPMQDDGARLLNTAARGLGNWLEAQEGQRVISREAFLIQVEVEAGRLRYLFDRTELMAGIVHPQLVDVGD